MATILKGGLLIDGSGNEPTRDATIVLDKGVITRVETARKVAPLADDTVIDAEGRGRVGIDFDPSQWLWREFEQLSAA